MELSTTAIPRPTWAPSHHAALPRSEAVPQPRMVLISNGIPAPFTGTDAENYEQGQKSETIDGPTPTPALRRSRRRRGRRICRLGDGNGAVAGMRAGARGGRSRSIGRIDRD